MNSTTNNPASDYRVLARKYRPGTFSELIGQDAMVQTLRNAMARGRLAHAFVLTGVRGVGKTTTARLIARSLNCSGLDKEGDIDPCGVCDNCVSIAESRHVDVLEMDAASRTGVDDIREIIESVRYAPVGSEYKIYIIDEVHMLSKSAFNALLKTLEEPPPHVKFIFATTEIRKIPLTVLSRCQRFDLRRVEADVLVGHLQTIVDKEGVTVEKAALASIARAAEGSVRDALSLLDQALAHGGDEVSADDIRAMLGLADRAQTLDLFEAMMAGNAADALENLNGQYDMGADPVVVLQDLLALTHWVTRLKVVPEAGPDALTSTAEQDVGTRLAKAISMAGLSRAWQMLLKGVGEVRHAGDPLAAAEMVLIRMTYAADMPTPADLVKKLQSGTAETKSANTPATSAGPTPEQSPGNDVGGEARAPSLSPATSPDTSGKVLALNTDADGTNVAEEPMPVSYQAFVDMFGHHREGILEKHLSDDVRLVSYKPGALSLNLGDNLPVDFAARLRACLEAWTGSQWQIIISNEEGAPSLRRQAEAGRLSGLEEARANVVVRALLDAFEGAEVVDVRPFDTKSETDREV